MTICFAELKKYKILLTTNVKRIKQVIKNYELSLSLGNCLSERFDWKKNYKEAFGGPCYKVWWPEFDFWYPHGGRRKLTPTICPLVFHHGMCTSISIHMHVCAHTYTPHRINSIIKKALKITCLSRGSEVMPPPPPPQHNVLPIFIHSFFILVLGWTQGCTC